MQNLLIIQKTFYKVADFISWTKKKSIDLSPNFQRRSVWKKGAKSFLIDTIYRGLPIPIIFLRDKGVNVNSFEPIREVIDGQQRLRTLLSFIAPNLVENFDANKDDFVVSKAHNKQIANKKFKDLEVDDQQKILNYEFSVHIIPQTISDRDVIQIFRRMNSSNYKLNSQELLNSQFFGEFKTSQYELASEQLDKWRKWGTFSENDISRMLEVELTSELCITIIAGKILGKSTNAIAKYYEKYEEKYPHKEIIEDRFRNTMDFIFTNFPGNKEDFVFYKRTIFYTFYIYIYSLLYGLQPQISKSNMRRVDSQTISQIKTKGDRIAKRVAPLDVLEATDRRSTSIGERRKLFTYFSK